MKKQTLPVLLVLALGICALLLADVKTDYDHQANFGKYHTYSWLKVQASDQLWQERIQRDVDSSLQEKGWQMVASGGDASVSAFGHTQNEQTMETFYDGFGGGWRWRGFGGEGLATTTVENTPVGTLTVDIFDTQSKQLLFRATATNTLSGSAEKNEKKLASTVQDMFKHFPPKPKG
jgi:Domain of unknown function (DUF4136)